MNSTKKVSVIVGVLYIIGTVAGICRVIFTDSSTAASAGIPVIASNIYNLKLGILLILLMGISLAFIPIIVYPIFSKSHKKLSIGFIVFRGAIEPVTYFITVIYLIAMVSLGQLYTENQSALDYYNNTLQLIKNMSSFPFTVFIFGIGALLFYAMLYKSKAIPQWLSVWGIIAIFLHFVTGFFIIFGIQDEFSLSNSIMNFPIFLQEMVMAVWLILKGFTISSESNT